MGNEQENSAEQKEAVSETEGLNREIEAGKAIIAEMKNSLAGKESEIAALSKSLGETQKAAEMTGKSLAAAVGAYRELIVHQNPGVLAELISGDSVETINKSLQSARAVMARARQEVEAEAAKIRVPAGAPQRVPQDLSALTAREKIQIGIKGN